MGSKIFDASLAAGSSSIARTFAKFEKFKLTCAMIIFEDMSKVE